MREKTGRQEVGATKSFTPGTSLALQRYFTEFESRSDISQATVELLVEELITAHEIAIEKVIKDKRLSDAAFSVLSDELAKPDH